jgi:hypothetical protein
MAKKKKKNLPPSSLIVTQSNQLVEARYNLPLAEQRLILTMISRIQPDDEDFKPYRIPIKEFAEFMGIDKNSAYRECKKITKSLLTRVIEIAEPGRLLQIGWVSSADYIDGSGMVNLCFDPLLKPYLLKLKGNFTSYKLEMILSFKSQYSVRIYMLLKQYQRLGDREIQIGLLRDMLGLLKDQHKEYSNLKNNILKPVQKELIEKADLYFEFEEIKHGRRVEALKFKIFSKQNSQSMLPSEVPLPEPEIKTGSITLESGSSLLDKLLALIPDQHRAKKTVVSALESYEKKHGVSYVERNILYTNEKAEKSYAGFLNNALKEDWGHDWYLEEQSKLKPSVKPKQMEIWEKLGFTSMKEYDEHMWRQQMDLYGVANH